MLAVHESRPVAEAQLPVPCLAFGAEHVPLDVVPQGWKIELGTLGRRLVSRRRNRSWLALEAVR